jgi:hypothetical protein
MISTNTPIAENSFKGRMEKLDDKELLNVIKNGTEYQPEAAEAAVMEAAKRELISQEEGEKLLGYTIARIKQNEEELAETVETNRAKGRIQMVLGVILFTAGLVFTITSNQYVWIGALVAGPILFLKGLFK